MSVQTPWGESVLSEKVSRGIIRYTTADGGSGFHLTTRENQKILWFLRNEDGWYQEMHEWYIPAIQFRDRFARFISSSGLNGEDYIRDAFEYFKKHKPDQYLQFQVNKEKTTMESEESVKAAAEHGYRWVARSAVIDPQYPAGLMLAEAVLGIDYGDAKAPVRHFLVGEKEWEAEKLLVIDPGAHIPAEDFERYYAGVQHVAKDSGEREVVCLNTPWGEVQKESLCKISDGIYEFSVEGVQGYWLEPERNVCVPAACRTLNGYYGAGKECLIPVVFQRDYRDYLSLLASDEVDDLMNHWVEVLEETMPDSVGQIPGISGLRTSNVPGHLN